MNTDKTNVLSSIFTRKGGEGQFTKLFEHFDEAEKARLERMLDQSVGEEPVLAVIKAGCLVLITNRRVLVQKNGQVSEYIDLASIMDVVPVDFRGKKKEELNQLHLKLSDGSERILDLEPGSAFFGVWNIFLHVARKNLKR